MLDSSRQSTLTLYDLLDRTNFPLATEQLRNKFIEWTNWTNINHLSSTFSGQKLFACLVNQSHGCISMKFSKFTQKNSPQNTLVYKALPTLNRCPFVALRNRVNEPTSNRQTTGEFGLSVSNKYKNYLKFKINKQSHCCGSDLV